MFIEIDKSLFKSKRNVMIGEIYRSPSSNQNTFNTELEIYFLNLKINKNMHV